MQFLEKEICQITEGVWNDLLGMGVNRIAEAGPQNGGGKTLTGSVRIKGGWQGEVRLQCSAEFHHQRRRWSSACMPSIASSRSMEQSRPSSFERRTGQSDGCESAAAFISDNKLHLIAA